MDESMRWNEREQPPTRPVTEQGEKDEEGLDTTTQRHNGMKWQNSFNVLGKSEPLRTHQQDT